MSVRLQVIGGPHQGKAYQFREHDSFIVGRGKLAHFRLAHDDQYVSRAHFMVEVNPPMCRLVDLGSNNGTKVNNLRVQSVDLKNGDVISAGKTLIQVEIDSQVKSTPPAGDLASAEVPISQSDVVTREYRHNPPAPEIELDGLELLPSTVDPQLETRVLDPQGYLPANFLERIIQQPQPIAGYRLVSELGRGGMGTVYLAIRERDQSIVALKTILPGTVANQRDEQRFLREAEIVRQLIHPQIVAYRDSGECDGLLYFSMEYVPGSGADTLVKRAGGSLPIARAVKVTLQLLSALRYAHAEGFVHRDIKPSNLLIIESKTEDVVKLADFGLARAYQASGMSGLTMTGEISGTFGFMSPEQITDFRGAKPATDQYAAAATLYYLLTGQFIHNFPGDAGKRLLMILDKQPVPIRDRRPEIPEPLAAAIHRALTHDPQGRFPDIRDFYAAIEPFSRITST